MKLAEMKNRIQHTVAKLPPAKLEFALEFLEDLQKAGDRNKWDLRTARDSDEGSSDFPIRETNVHERLPELHKHIVSDREPVTLTHQNGNMVLISKKEWETFRETMLLLKDKAALKALVRSFEDHDSGKTAGKSVEEVFSDLI